MLLWWIYVGISLSLVFYWWDPSQSWQSRKIQHFSLLHESINLTIHWPPWNWHYLCFHSELPLGRLPSRLLIMLDVFLKCFFHWDSLFLEISIKKIFILYNTRTESYLKTNLCTDYCVYNEAHIQPNVGKNLGKVKCFIIEGVFCKVRQKYLTKIFRGRDGDKTRLFKDIFLKKIFW